MITNQNNLEKSYNNQVFNGNTNLITPLADTLATKDYYKIILDLPGVSKKEFKIKVDADELVITGLMSKDDKEKEYIYNEIYYSGYRRHFQMPKDVDVEKIDANYEDGVLTITLPKKDEFKPRFIEIN